MIYSSCVTKIPPTINLTDGKYISGKVIYRAERDFQTGMIQIDDIFHIENNSVNDFLESPSRAVFYNFDEELPLNLWEQVWFQIEEINCIQIAIDIHQMKDSHKLDIMNTREQYALINKIHFNLHNGDKHREGPKHRRINILKNYNTGFGLNSDENNPPFEDPLLSKLGVKDIETEDEFIIYVRTTEVPAEEEYEDPFYIEFDMILGSYTVFLLDINHLH